MLTLKKISFFNTITLCGLCHEMASRRPLAHELSGSPACVVVRGVCDYYITTFTFKSFFTAPAVGAAVLSPSKFSVFSTVPAPLVTVSL